MNNFIIEMLEKQILEIPDEEIRKRMENFGFPEENLNYIMECVSNSRKKYETQEDKTSGDSNIEKK